VNDKKKFSLLWRYSTGFRLIYAAGILAMAIAYVFMYGVPLVAKFAIDAILDPDAARLPMWLAPWIEPLLSPGMLGYLVLAASTSVVLTALGGIFLFFRGRFAAIASEGIVRSLRERVFHHLEHLPANFHDQADTGDLVQRCTSDMETLRVFLSGQVIEISRAVLLLITVLPILFTLDVRMAWLSIITMPILLVFAVYFFQRVKNLFLEVDESEAELTTVLQENLTGIRVVRAFARQEYEIQKFAVRNADFREKNKKLLRLLGIYYGVSDFICMGQIGLLLIVGGNWVLLGTLSIGTLFAFLTYVGMIIWPIRHMGRVLTDSGKAIVAMGRLAEILFEPIESQSEEDPGKRLSGHIALRNLSFAYETGNQVLDDVTFSIESGQTLAILGPPGSGKSTITRLLLRLYDYGGQGSITLDGRELSHLHRKYVRSQISIVLQEPFLYSASIGENLLIGRPDASEEEIHQAARDAGIHSSILRFPRGYDSMVGERGVTLSGGQRQRLALARALLKDPPVLILDDALSAVDTDTEAQILDALKKRRKGGTTIIIAHRLSSVLHADKIIVLDEGRVVQEGNHQSLIQQPGIYHRLCDIQGAIQQQIESDLKDVRHTDIQVY